MVRTFRYGTGGPDAGVLGHRDWVLGDMAQTQNLVAGPPVLVSTGHSQTTASLAWSVPSSPAPITYYILQTSNDGRNWGHLASTANLEYTHTGRSLSTRVGYRVRGVNMYGFGAWSNELFVLTDGPGNPDVAGLPFVRNHGNAARLWIDDDEYTDYLALGEFNDSLFTNTAPAVGRPIIHRVVLRHDWYMRVVFAGTDGLNALPDDLFGLFSLVIWSTKIGRVEWAMGRPAQQTGPVANNRLVRVSRLYNVNGRVARGRVLYDAADGHTTRRPIPSDLPRGNGNLLAYNETGSAINFSLSNGDDFTAQPGFTRGTIGTQDANIRMRGIPVGLMVAVS